MNKPSIVSVLSRYVSLRRRGKEYFARCPFHADKNPSFSVNEDKGVFYCHGCGVKGDVFQFVALIERTDFKSALKILGIDGRNYTPKPVRDSHTRRSATMLAAWMNEQHLKVGGLCRELTRKIALAESVFDPELVESLTRECEILFDLHNDLQSPECAGELWEARGAVETITRWAEPEPLPTFPELTSEYREYLRAAVRGELC